MTFNYFRNNSFVPRLLLLALMAVMMLFGARKAMAQSSNQWRGMVAVGASYERGLDATVSFEKELKYHNAMEFFFTGYLQWDDDELAGHVTKDSFWHSYNTWSVGMAYKPCIHRGRNHHGNFRLGVSCGSDLDKFIGVIHVGYEHSYALKGGWELFFQLKEDVAICAKDLWRTGGAVGIKIPL